MNPEKNSDKYAEELKACREKLRILQKKEAICDVVPVIFHKLKNKLTPILGYSQILLTKTGDDALLNRIRKIELNADELAEQLNVLKGYFEDEECLKEKENLNRILDALRPTLAAIEKERQVRINVDTAPGIPDDYLSGGQIEMLILNMVDNALPAIKKKNAAAGVIDIKTALEEGGYRLSIKDNGIGMKEKDIPRIWTPFFSGCPGRAGIGLTICEKIITNHKAAFTVASVAGEFSEFIISFKINQ
ncbi:MAG: HAMP domain-containing histidine kinase [Candidatus Aminicenantes bacterium]|nr:HAMP domain-containing histidine kinase [Candidatus Aminicenantes bacterium]